MLKEALVSVFVVAAAACLDFKYSEKDGNLSYAYYRQGNYNKSAALVTTPAVSAFIRTWNQEFSIYDSPDTVHVTRFDIAAKVLTQLGAKDTFVRLKGPAYFMTTAPKASLTDVMSATANHFGREYKESPSDTFAYNSIAWVSGGCQKLSVDPTGAKDPDRNMSLLVVTSGAFEAEFVNDKSGCEASQFLSGETDLHNNPVDYKPVGPCTNPLMGHGVAPDYDDLDAPIGPLGMHYHTRGALYYISAGSSVYDKGVDALQEGELRFVQSGYYYGPETVSAVSYISSLHEPDPSARRLKNTTATGADDDEKVGTCAFACYDDPGEAPWLQCIRP
jgi:hypothetical protein